MSKKKCRFVSIMSIFLIIGLILVTTGNVIRQKLRIRTLS